MGGCEVYEWINAERCERERVGGFGLLCILALFGESDESIDVGVVPVAAISLKSDWVSWLSGMER